jgi:hypothetical protein
MVLPARQGKTRGLRPAASLRLFRSAASPATIGMIFSLPFLMSTALKVINSKLTSVQRRLKISCRLAEVKSAIWRRSAASQRTLQ